MTNHVTIVGSLNVDTTMKVKRMPLPGETIAALSKTNAAGGKGANQAVAAARSGAETAFVGQVGDDAGGGRGRRRAGDAAPADAESVGGGGVRYGGGAHGLRHGADPL